MEKKLNLSRGSSVSGTVEDKTGSTGKVPSRDTIINNILSYYDDEKSRDRTDQNQYELRRLYQAVLNHEGRFGILIAVSNSAVERDSLILRLTDILPEQQRPTVIDLEPTDLPLVRTLMSAQGKPAPLIVTGIERLLPSVGGWLQEQTLKELQLGRERFRRLGRPVIVWMPDYTYSLIGQRAVDFWSWQSGVFFFESSGTDREKLQNNWALTTSVSGKHQFSTNSDLLIPTGLRPQIEEAMNDLRHGRSVLLRGMGGVGKTSLALFLTERLAQDDPQAFPDNQLFISLDDSGFSGRGAFVSSVNEGLRHVIRTLRPELVALPEDSAGLSATYQHVLNGKRTLIVVDGVPNKEALRLFLPPPNSVLLATSRSKWRTPPQMRVINLDRLSAEDARGLLLNLVPWIDQESADEICKLCDYLPLAIRLVGGIITRGPEHTPERYLHTLRDRIHAPQGHPPDTLEAVLSASYEGLSAEASCTLRYMAVFPTSFDASAEEEVCDDPHNKNLVDLLERQLVTVVGTPDRYSLHPLVRQFALKHLSRDEQNRVARKHSRYYANLLSTTNQNYKEGTESAHIALRIFDSEWANINAGQSWAALHLENDREALELCNLYPYAGRELLELRQHPRERIQWLEAALAAARLLHDKKSESAHLSLMGIAHLALGEISQSISLFKDSLELARNLGHKQLTSVALGNLASGYQRQGRLRESIDVLNEALRIAREIGDQRTEISILKQLGDIHVSLGEFNVGIEFFERSLGIIRELGDDRLESSALIGLGNAQSRLGELYRAVEYYEQSLALARKVKHRNGEAAALSNLGVVYREMGNVSAAVAPLEEALSIFREIGDRQGEAMALGNLAIAFAESGSYREASELFGHMLEIVRDAGNKEAEALALCNLGYVYSMVGENSNSRALFEQALEILKEVGDRHGVARALSGIANTYANVGDSARAISFYEQAVEISRELGSRRSVAHILNNLGDVSIRDRRFEQAIGYLQQSLDIAREIGARPVEADALWHLGEANHQLGRTSFARNYAQEALAIYNQTKHPNVSKVQAALTEWSDSI